MYQRSESSLRSMSDGEDSAFAERVALPASLATQFTFNFAIFVDAKRNATIFRNFE